MKMDLRVFGIFKRGISFYGDWNFPEKHHIEPVLADWNWNGLAISLAMKQNCEYLNKKYPNGIPFNPKTGRPL